MPKTSKIFRLFVSSTFADFHYERTALQYKVFPVLEKLCQSYGAKFQAIDLRWGVSEEAQLDHKTLDICLQELQRCLDISPKPNFLILMGERYGWRPLPTHLTEEEYTLCAEMSAKVGAQPLFDAWYEREDNYRTPTYVLKPRRGIYVEQETWAQVEGTLRTLFDYVLAEAQLPVATAEKFSLSATEHEIRHGALSSEQQDEHVIAFFRKLQADHAAHPDYFEVEGTVSHTQLLSLQARLRQLLAPDNQLEQTVASMADLQSEHYMETVAEQLLARLVPLVEAECQKMKEIGFTEAETIRHAEFADNRRQNFIGRESYVQTIEQLFGQHNKPVVLHGLSGAGKSAFAAMLSAKLVEKYPQALHITRFVGASSFGQTTKELMQSLICALEPAAEQDILAIDSIGELMERFVATLQSVCASQTVYMIVDALDQLADFSLGGGLLNEALPENVHLLCTVATDQEETFTKIASVIDKEQLVYLAPLAEDEGEYIVDEWLKQIGRTIQPYQRAVVKESIAKCSLPLFLRLAFEEMKQWPASFQPKSFPTSVQEMIDYFLARLLNNIDHGEQFAEHALGFIVSSRSGLAEDELLYLLSHTKAVKDEFLARSKHDYHEALLPSVIWARLYYDLEPYLMEKKLDEHVVYSFYHRQIEQKIRATYEKRHFHEKLAHYYEEQPLFYEQMPNKRKVYEVVYQLMQLEDYERVAYYLTDFDFIWAKYEVNMGADLLEEYRVTMPHVSEETERLQQFYSFCRMQNSAIQRYPQDVRSFALKQKVSVCYELALQQLMEKGAPVLLPTSQTSHIATSKALGIADYWQYSFHTNDADILDIACDEAAGVVFSLSKTLLRKWDLSTGKLLAEKVLVQHEFLHMELAQQYLHLYGETVYAIFECESMRECASKKLGESIRTVSIHPTTPRIAVVNENGVAVFNFSLQKTAHFELWPIQIAWSPMSDELAFVGREEVRLVNIASGEQRSMASPIVYNMLSHMLVERQCKYQAVYRHDDNVFMHVVGQNVMLWDCVDGRREETTDFSRQMQHFLMPHTVVSIQDAGQVIVWNPTTYDIQTQFFIDNTKKIKAVEVTAHYVYMLFHDGEIAQLLLKGQEHTPQPMTIPLVNDSWLWVLKPYYTKLARFSSTLAQTAQQLGQGEATAFKKAQVIYSKMSPQYHYIASLLSNGAVQIIHRDTSDILELSYAAPNEPIVFIDWTNDEELLVTTKKKLARIDPKTGTVNNKMRFQEPIVTVAASLTTDHLVVLLQDGMLSYIHTAIDHRELCQTELTAETHFEWSPLSEQLVAICACRLYVYNMQQAPKPTLIIEAPVHILAVFWMDEATLYVLDADMELSLIHLQQERSVTRMPLLGKELEPYRVGSLHEEHVTHMKLLRQPFLRKSIAFYKELRGEQKQSPFAQMAPALAFTREKGLLAIGQGRWLTIRSASSNAVFYYYMDQPIYTVCWQGDTLLVVDQLMQEFMFAPPN